MSIEIRLLTTEAERATAVRFIAENAFRWHQCKPPPAPQLLFGAWDGTEIVGTIALDFGDAQTPLPIEQLYEIDYGEFPWLREREKIAQFGRFFVTQPDISVALLYVATTYALACGKLYGLSEAKPHVPKRFAELGIRLQEVKRAQLVEKHIPADGLSYYQSAPQPRLWGVSLHEKAAALRTPVTVAVNDGRISLEEETQYAVA